MENDKVNGAGTDLSALLAGAKTQADRDNLIVAFRHFAQTHPDSFAAQQAALTLANARSSQDAARRNEEAAKQIQEAAAQVEKALPDPDKLMTILAKLPTRDHVAQVLAQGEKLSSQWNQHAETVRRQVDKVGHKIKRPILLFSATAGVLILVGVLVGVMLMRHLDDKRIEQATAQADARLAALYEKLPYATWLEMQLEQIGAKLTFRRTPAVANQPERQELVLKPGPGFRAKEAYVNKATGEAVITFP